MDELLIRKAQNGDRESFSAAVMELKDRAYRIAYCYLHNREDSMDAVCDAVEKAYRNIKKLNNAGLFSTWFIRIVINECKTHLRKYCRETVTEDVMATAAAREKDEQAMDLEILLKELDAQDRMLIYMKYYMGYTLIEISGLTDLSLWNIKSRIYGNLKKMKGKLQLGEVEA